jgi:hypothetical protein
MEFIIQNLPRFLKVAGEDGLVETVRFVCVCVCVCVCVYACVYVIFRKGESVCLYDGPLAILFL